MGLYKAAEELTGGIPEGVKPVAPDKVIGDYFSSILEVNRRVFPLAV